MVRLAHSVEGVTGGSADRGRDLREREEPEAIDAVQGGPGLHANLGIASPADASHEGAIADDGRERFVDRAEQYGLRRPVLRDLQLRDPDVDIQGLATMRAEAVRRSRHRVAGADRSSLLGTHRWVDPRREAAPGSFDRSDGGRTAQKPVRTSAAPDRKAGSVLIH